MVENKKVSQLRKKLNILTSFLAVNFKNGFYELIMEMNEFHNKLLSLVYDQIITNYGDV